MPTPAEMERDIQKEREKARRKRRRAMRRESLVREQRKFTLRIADRQREIDRLDEEDRRDT